VQADHLDEALDLGLGAADQELAAGLAEASGDHGQVDHQRGVGEDQLVEVDEDRSARMERP
jgi:hypothetical protein